MHEQSSTRLKETASQFPGKAYSVHNLYCNMLFRQSGKCQTRWQHSALWWLVVGDPVGYKSRTRAACALISSFVSSTGAPEHTPVICPNVLLLHTYIGVVCGFTYSWYVTVTWRSRFLSPVPSQCPAPRSSWTVFVQVKNSLMSSYNIYTLVQYWSS